MRSWPTWQYDEFQHCGVDYNDTLLAESFDEQHACFRGDMAAAAEDLLDELGVTPGQTLLDLGCGTGFLAVQAARRCRTVYAVDVSPAMLQVARRKADAAGVENIVFSRGGFLTYEHTESKIDVITSMAALHHLPDFWKLIGLRRITDMLADDGLFYLMDSVYSFPPDEYAHYFDGQVAWAREHVNEAFSQEITVALRDEHSTWDWIMEGLLTKAGFTIERALYPGLIARYWCRKRKG